MLTNRTENLWSGDQLLLHLAPFVLSPLCGHLRGLPTIAACTAQGPSAVPRLREVPLIWGSVFLSRIKSVQTNYIQMIHRTKPHK